MRDELVKFLRTDKLAKKIIPGRFAASFEKSKTTEGFDRTLERLYDFCDINRIWMGF